MGLTILPLSVERMRYEGQGLLAEHYEELTLNKEVVKLDVDWLRYEKLEAGGLLKAWGAWEEGELVGYSCFFLCGHLHYSGLTVAMNDVLFLRKDRRLGMTGIRLIKESEKQLALLAAGPMKIIWHVKHNTSLGPLLERFGYADEEYSMAKIVGV